MRLTIFGATGGTGAQLVRLALAAGHDVTAVARNPSQVGVQDDRLRVLRGDVLDPASVEAAIREQNVVISCIGGTSDQHPVTLYSAGTDNLLSAMRVAGVRRLECISANPLDVGNGDVLLDRLVLKPIVRVIFKESYADLARMEAKVRASDVDWTIMRPPRLINRSATGDYRIAFDRNLPRGRFIGRADLAAAMLQMLDNPQSIRASVTVAY